MRFIGRPVRLPEPIAGALEALLGSSVHDVQIFEHSVFVRLHGRALATTRRGRIYLRDGAGEFFGDPWLMLHEYCHVIRQWAPGALTIRRYLAECLRRGYWNNRFELEARQFADAHAHQLRTLLGQNRPATPGPVREPPAGPPISI